MIRATLTALALASCCAAGPARALASEAQSLFEHGFLARAEGHEGDAFDAFRRAFEADPYGAVAADALYYGAEVADQLAHDYPRAVPIYEELITRFPETRYARRTANRLAFLARARSAGDEALGLYEETLARYALLGSDAALSRMQSLVERFPQFPLLAAAWLWIADEHHGRGEVDSAVRGYDLVMKRWPDSPEATDARKKRGDIAMAAGRWEAALAWYRATGDGAGGVAPAIVARLVEQALEQRNRAYVARASGVFVAGLLGWLLVRTRWAALAAPGFASPLRELAILGPSLGVVVLAASTRHPIVFRSIAMAAGLDVTLAVANALYVESRGSARAGRPAHVIALVLGFAAILYVSCYANGLHVLLEETLRTGPESS